uniref:Uncharacterized protein n=1 Tax=Megaselia scalaris TaxID=36166 RepID=T1GPF3_MEGSC
MTVTVKSDEHTTGDGNGDVSSYESITEETMRQNEKLLRYSPAMVYKRKKGFTPRMNWKLK